MSDKKRKFQTIAVVALLAITLVLEGLPQILSDPRKNFFFCEAMALFFGFLAFCIIMNREGSGLFRIPQKLVFLLPAIIIAVDNFQFASFFAGKMQPIQADFFDWVLFIFYCFTTGLFEEAIFRGTLFPLLADRFEKTKKGLLKTIICSSVIFGLAHLFNLFSGGGIGVLLQVCYSTLTGLLFAFVLIKTKNVLCCAFIHGLYNFCGLLFSADVGLGFGVVFDFATGLIMLIVCSIVAVFAVIAFVKYSEEERKELYSRLGFGVKIQ